MQTPLFIGYRCLNFILHSQFYVEPSTQIGLNNWTSLGVFMIIKSAHECVHSILCEHLDPSNWIDLSIELGVVNQFEHGRIHFLVRITFLDFP
jgi:hypothetical protein